MFVGKSQTLELHPVDAGFAFLQNALSALRRSAQPSRNRDDRRDWECISTSNGVADHSGHNTNSFHTFLLLTDHQLIGLFEELCWNRAIRLPCDVHRAGALMFHIVRRSQIGVGGCTAKTGVRLEFTDEQQHPASLCTVMDQYQLFF